MAAGSCGMERRTCGLRRISTARTHHMTEPRYSRSPAFRRVAGLWCAAWLSLGARTVAAQTFQLSSADVADSAALTKSMPRLAAAGVGTYPGTPRARFLRHLLPPQILPRRDPGAAGRPGGGRAPGPAP